MKRAILAATAAALIAGSAATYAASTDTSAAAERPGRPHLSAEDRAILSDARIAALKTALKLTPEQEKLWPQVETTLKDVAKERASRMEQARAARQAARQSSAPVDPIARMRATANRLDAGAADLRKIADAADPLYKTLDDAQKQRLNAVIHQNMRGFGSPHWRQGAGPQRG